MRHVEKKYHYLLAFTLLHKEKFDKSGHSFQKSTTSG
jgi:hypothetical protein